MPCCQRWLAVVAAGLCGSVLDRRYLGTALWSAVTMTLNGAVFVMPGLEMRQVLHRVEGYSRWNLPGYVVLLTLATFTLLMACWSGRHRPAGEKNLPSFTMLLVTVMCSVRGPLALSAALAIPLLTHAGLEMPARDLAVFLAAATMGATLALSGLVRPLLSIEPAVDGSPPMSFQDVHAPIARTALKAIDSDPLRMASGKVREWSRTWRGLYESRAAANDVSNAHACAEHRRDLATQQQLSTGAIFRVFMEAFFN